mmetsp:Transcript_21045/g.44885  ORF Transcript_21045/g.44885 Transcript_21045/m.44885 type:complete len:642 (+) Transcript_21045:55-1980(+)
MALDMIGNINSEYDRVLMCELPKWIKDTLKQQPRSLTNTSVTLQIYKSEEVIQLPCLQSTTVIEIKQMLASRLGIDWQDLDVVVKQGACWRKQTNHEDIARKVVITGISSFMKQKQVWPHPVAIIGAGHLGLKTAMCYLKHGTTNFVVYDRKHTVGGTSWWDQANTTSKLQTELGAYHLEFHEDNPVPTDMKTQPSRDELLAHFKKVAEDYGVMPYCKFNTDVKQIAIQKGEKASSKQWWADQTYRFFTNTTADGKVTECEVEHSCVSYFPGNLTVPREEVYKGEEQFDGYIMPAICNNVDYSRVADKDMVIVGHGAFAVENIRTCCEHGVKKVWLVCRRKNLCCPRYCSWLINGSHNAISGPLYMRSTEPMYKLTPFDPWEYHSVHTNEKRSFVAIKQKARFGIGDVYFLAYALGLLEVLEDRIKRLTKGTVHLESGKKLDTDVILKLLGFVGSWDVDRLITCKEIVGYWPQCDFRRFVFAEPIGVDASNFGGTSFSPGARQWAFQACYFTWYPKDFQPLTDGTMLPKHKAEPEVDRPAYVIDARYNISASMIVSTIQGIAEDGAAQGDLKRRKQLELHPVEKYFYEIKHDWDTYAKEWKARGHAPNPIPEYPYTLQMAWDFFNEEQREFDEAMRKQFGG